MKCRGKRLERKNARSGVNAMYSEILQHYLYVYQNTKVTEANSTPVDTVLMIIRLRCKYYCQITGREVQPSRLCSMVEADTLEHCIEK